VQHCRTGRDIVAQRLAAMPRVRAIPSPGAFYAMFEIEGVTDTLHFCKRAVHEARIGMAPGTSFGRGSEKLIRLCYAKTPAVLNEAMDRLAGFVSDFREAES
jgi:aspartate/methionine/tyrosine aminotransferase